MGLRVGFLTTLGRNVGDEFIREGIRAALDATGVPYTPLYVDKHRPATLHEPAEDEVEMVADKYWDCDLFIQSGAPVYWHLLEGQATSLTAEWHRWMWEERIFGSPPEGKRRPIFVNLGAGSCQPWGGDATPFLTDASCADFARRAGARARLTTVRDPVAAHLLTSLGLDHRALPCPAYLAAARHRLDAAPAGGHIGLNFMPLGGHFDLGAGFDPLRWEEDCREIAALLRAMGPLVFIAHDAAERDWLGRFAGGSERVFLAAGWRDYLDVYAGCALVVANRVHGAVCAAGFGAPGIILGNDTRAQIGCALDLTILQSGSARPGEVQEAAERLLAGRPAISSDLRTRRDAARRTYRDLLRPILEDALEQSRRR